MLEKTKANLSCIPDRTFEVVVIEDNKLINTILSNVLDSTINKIVHSTKYPIKFSSFYFGADFLTYLENRNPDRSELIVFSDYYLENDMNGAKILKRIKQKGIDATVIIMSDATNKQTSIDTVYMGAHCFLFKNSRTPFVCSSILSRILDNVN